MVKKRIGDPWMPAPAFSRSLPQGIGLNLLVPEIEPMRAFCQNVLGGSIIYADPDFCVVNLQGSTLLLHADHTYLTHPMSGVIDGVVDRGLGAEIRLYGVDPDTIEQRARAAGFTVLSGAIDKPHGLRECHIFGPSGYVFVPSRTI